MIEDGRRILNLKFYLRNTRTSHFFIQNRQPLALLHFTKCLQCKDETGHLNTPWIRLLQNKLHQNTFGRILMVPSSKIANPSFDLLRNIFQGEKRHWNTPWITLLQKNICISKLLVSYMCNRITFALNEIIQWLLKLIMFDKADIFGKDAVIRWPL